MDSTETGAWPAGEQRLHGHFESTCYHPLLLFNREGDCLAAKLRPGNVHSPTTGRTTAAEIERQQKLAKRWCFVPTRPLPAGDLRGAGRARREVCDPHPVQRQLGRDIAELLTRPVGRPSHKPVVWYRAFSIRQPVGKRRGGSWRRWSSTLGNCSPSWLHRTNLTLPSRAVVRFYNKRGTAEQWIKEGKQAVEDDTAELPSFPVQRSATVAERDRL